MPDPGAALSLAVIETAPASVLPSLIVQLAALQAAAAARMAIEATRPVMPLAPDRLLQAPAAAALIGWSPRAWRGSGDDP